MQQFCIRYVGLIDGVYTDAANPSFFIGSSALVEVITLYIRQIYIRHLYTFSSQEKKSKQKYQGHLAYCDYFFSLQAKKKENFGNLVATYG